jgi:raffinose/stachyose/melibiose transport system substrate-binding protein
VFPALPVPPGDRRRPAARSRRWAVAAAVAATAVTAAACGAPGSSAPAAQSSTGAAGQAFATTAPKGPVTLNFYIESGFPLPEKLAAEFQKQYPNVKIKLREDQFAVLTQNAPRVMAGNDAPDLIRLPTIVSSAKDGLLANLDGYAKAYGWDKYPAGLLNQMRVSQGVRGSGPLYAMGIGYDVTGVFYNKALAARIGMTRPPQTVAEMESDLAKAKAEGIQPIMQFNDIGGINFPYQALLNQYEAPSRIADWVFDKPGANIDTPAAVKAADQIAAWGKAGYFTKDANALTYTDMMSRFGKGQGLFMFNGDWESQNLQKTMGKNVGFFLAPPATAGGRPVAMSAPDTYAIPAKSKNIAATAFFLNWVHTNPKARQLVVDVTGASPGGPSDLPIPPVPSGSVVAQTLEATRELGEKGVAVDFTANATAGIYANTIKPELQKLITGRETGAGFAKALQADYAKELGQ